LFDRIATSRPKDILILDGGPAGLSTALHHVQIAPHLSDQILILEKAHYPRPKLRAGGLTADAEIILQRLRPAGHASIFYSHQLQTSLRNAGEEGIQA